MSKRLFYSFDPDEGIEFHPTAEAAQTRAQQALNTIEGALPDGLFEDRELDLRDVSWGEVRGIGTHTRVEHTDGCETGDTFCEVCDAGLGIDEGLIKDIKLVNPKDEA